MSRLPRQAACFTRDPRFLPRVAQGKAAEVLQGLFDLTPAEARVARSVAALQTVDAIAAALGVSRETVRTHLKSVLDKTGVPRQGDLAALLAGSSLRSDEL